MAASPVSAKPAKRGRTRPKGRRAAKIVGPHGAKSAIVHGSGPAELVMEEARRAGLLDGERTVHVSFRAPEALVEAARRESGVVKPTELGLLALAMLAQPDPTAAYLKATRGQLGADHVLDY